MFTKIFVFLVKRIIFVIHLKLPGCFLKFWDLGILEALMSAAEEEEELYIISRYILFSLICL